MFQTQRFRRGFIPDHAWIGPIKALLVWGGTLLGAGCAHGPHQQVPFQLSPQVTVELEPAHRLPVQAGSVYVYDQNQVKRLLAVEKSHLVWQVGDDTHWGSTDFFAPLVQKNEGQVTSTLDGQPEALWPLSVGRSVVFRETRLTNTRWSSKPRTQTLEWRCDVLPATVAHVPAGDYPSWPVSCSARPPGWPLATERITWDYAPALGQPVRVVWFEGGQQRGSVLWAALPGKSATPEAVQRLLSRLAQATDNATPKMAPPNHTQGRAP